MPVKNRREKGKDSAVQGTNDSSVVSKASAAALGYFRDDFLQQFVGRVSRRTPLINRGYYVRWKAVDLCVKRFLRVTASCSRRQVLSLGAGFDSLFFRLNAEGLLEGVTFFEIDFPEVARRKATLIGDKACLRNALPDWDSAWFQQTAGGVWLSSGGYTLLGVDVREEQELEVSLRAAGVLWEAPTLLLSEVVLTYMETQWSDKVIAWAARRFQQSMFVMYEQIRPDDPFGQVMQNHFTKLNSSLHSLSRYPDAAAHTHRFMQQGWETCVCLDMNQFYSHLLPDEERRRVESLEPFDEFEEWHQKCSHYFILTACNGPETRPAMLPTPTAPEAAPRWRERPLLVQLLPGAPCVQVVGVSSARLRPGVILLSGGCGRGGRDTAARLLLKESDVWKCVCVETRGDTVVGVHQSLTAVPGGGAVLFGGRTSPLSSIGRVVSVTFDLGDLRSQRPARVSFDSIACTGRAPRARWRHTATLVCHRGRHFLFVFGGRTEDGSVLDDWHFLCLEDKSWTEIPVDGAAPEARHSHSASRCDGGLVIFGGLADGGRPLGDAFRLSAAPSGFCWEKIRLHPPPEPRFSHQAHVLRQELLLVVGGVWLQAEGVPGVMLMNLNTGSCEEIRLNTLCVPWPVMLQSFCSELLDSDDSLLLIGGGGNCFSFGTHLNTHPVTVDLTDTHTHTPERDSTVK